MSYSNDGGSPDGAAARGIVFKAQLEALRAQRRAFVFERHFTIGGAIEQSVHQELDAHREKLIGYMENRFRGIKGHIENEFGVSKMRAVATHDFECER